MPLLASLRRLVAPEEEQPAPLPPCRARAHVRTNIDWVDGQFVSTCARCGRPIRRVSSDEWQAV